MQRNGYTHGGGIHNGNQMVQTDHWSILSFWLFHKTSLLEKVTVIAKCWVRKTIYRLNVRIQNVYNGGNNGGNNGNGRYNNGYNSNGGGCGYKLREVLLRNAQNKKLR